MNFPVGYQDLLPDYNTAHLPPLPIRYLKILSDFASLGGYISSSPLGQVPISSSDGEIGCLIRFHLLCHSSVPIFENFGVLVRLVVVYPNNGSIRCSSLLISGKFAIRLTITVCFRETLNILCVVC